MNDTEVMMTPEEWAESVNEAVSVQAQALEECAKRIITLEKALESMVKSHQDLMVTVEKIATALNETNDVLRNGAINYKPEDHEEHLNMKGNFDLIYSRLIELESKNELS